MNNTYNKKQLRIAVTFKYGISFYFLVYLQVN